MPQTYGALIASLSAWFCFYIILLYFKKVKHAILLVKRMCIFFSCSGLLKAFCLAELKRNVKLLLGGKKLEGRMCRRSRTRCRREKTERTPPILFPIGTLSAMATPQSRYRSTAPLKGEAKNEASPFRGKYLEEGMGVPGSDTVQGLDLAVASNLAPPQSRLRSPAPPKGEAPPHKNCRRKIRRQFKYIII